MQIHPMQVLKSRLELFLGWFHPPRPITRTDLELKSLARETRGLALYYHQLCPVSVRVCRLIHRLNVPIEFRSIRRSQVHRDDLISGMGYLCTPGLKIVEQGEVTWICGEEQVTSYLCDRFLPESNSDIIQ